uniref:Sensory appendage protein-like protein n=1 Tax=Mamestra brassicae TaxID=55057 RepID=Q9BIF5_MAMBR|nr:sensory appendage protein-like protein [Mamestra brassicae]
MKVLVVLSVLVAFAAAAKLTTEELQMLEAFDYDALFANDEQRKIVFDCLLDKGDCGAYKQLADLSMKLIINNCAECSPTQKTKYEHVLKQLHDNYEPVYNDILKKVAAIKE